MKVDGDLTESEKIKLNYDAARESRPFHFKRYNLSKGLPDMIKSLAAPNTLVFHRGYEIYATYKVVNDEGVSIDYIVSFSVFREQKKLRLHVRTVFPEEKSIGQVKKN